MTNKKFHEIFISDDTATCMGISKEDFDRVVHIKPNIPKISIPPMKKYEYKNKLPLLKSYKGELPDFFWRSILHRFAPGGVLHNRSVKPFEYHKLMKIAMKKGFMSGLYDNTFSTKEIFSFRSPLINAVTSDLIQGAKLHFDIKKFKALNFCENPGHNVIICPNSSQLGKELEGSIFADKLQSGLVSGMYIGPFRYPLSTLPVKCPETKQNIARYDVRLSVFNRLFMVNQSGKFRVITDLSSPKGTSINDCILTEHLRSLKMSTIPQVFEKVHQVGPSCRLSKLDLTAAYQQLNLRSCDMPLHGFMFGNRYFYNTKLVFGESSSPAIFDDFNYLNTEICLFNSNLPHDNFFRVLDDSIVVSEPSFEHEKFVTEFENFCEKTHIVLAPYEDNKAFKFATEGEILGIHINCEQLEWSLREEKRLKILAALVQLYQKKSVTVMDLQIVLGLLNIIVMLSPPLRFYRDHLLVDLSRALRIEKLGFSHVTLTAKSKRQLEIWINILNLLAAPLPIHNILHTPSLGTVVISTDAAGNQAADLDKRIGAGVAWKRYDSNLDQTVTVIAQAFFRHPFITIQRDHEGKLFGCKTSVLEALGVMLALFHFLPAFSNKSLVIETDNSGLVWAYKKGRSRTCPYLNMFLESINYVAMMYSVNLYIRHVHRKTTQDSACADALTRDDNDMEAVLLTTKQENQFFNFPDLLNDWMDDPYVADSFPFDFYRAIQYEN